MPELFDHDPDLLRREIATGLICQEFSAEDVPAFLLLVQTQASGHSTFLWERTVIPLLAGHGKDLQARIDSLHSAFSGDRPVRSALRVWLRKYNRDLPYCPGSPFWFVNAVIGECALVQISGAFAAAYLDRMFTQGAVGELPPEAAESQFDVLVGSFIRSDQLAADDEMSVRALKDCLVEAGTRIARIARLMRNQVPPSGGWSVDGILDVSRKLLRLDLSGLPMSAVNVLRERIGFGISTHSFDQVLGIFRKYPKAKIVVHGNSWTPACGTALPVAEAQLYIGGQGPRRVVLADDLGREPDELVAMLEHGATDWHETRGVRWRVATHEFVVKHPSRLRSKARPILRDSDTVANPVGWVWTGPDTCSEWIDRDSTAASFSGWKEAVPPRLHLLAWQSVDRAGLPTFFTFKFRLINAPAGSLRLICQPRTGDEEVLWAGPASGRWVTLRRSVPATAGSGSLFRAEIVTPRGDESHPVVTWNWRVPALFHCGRRLRPGEQDLPSDGSDLFLISEQIPEVTNGSVHEVSDDDPALGGACLYGIQLDSKSLVSRVASSGHVWLFPTRTTPPTLLRLVAIDCPRLKEEAFTLSDAAVRVFFKRPPAVCVTMQNVDSDQLTNSEALELLRHSELCVGLDNDLSPECRVSLRELHEFINVERRETTVTFTLQLEDILPANLLDPSFVVQRIGLNQWLETDIGDQEANLPASNRSERFVVLPYDSEDPRPRTPLHQGSLALKDSSNLYDDLVLGAFGDDTLPSVGQTECTSVALDGDYPFTEMRIQSRRSIPLAGIWFYKNRLTLSDLSKLLSPESTPSCAVCVIPAERTLEFSVFANGLDLPLSTKAIEGPQSQEFSLLDVLSNETLADPKLQSKWLTASFSEIKATCDGEPAGCLAIDARADVTDFEILDCLGPTSAGESTVRFSVSVIPGLSEDRTFLVELVHLREERIVNTEELTWPSRSLSKHTEVSGMSLPHPGDYNLRLRRRSETVELLSIHVTARRHSPDERADLNELLAEFPDGQLSLNAICRLYDAMAHSHEPWNNVRLICVLENARDAFDRTDSCEYRLVDTLLAFLTMRHLPTVQLVRPYETCKEDISNVSSVVLQVQFNSPEPVRRDLQEWELRLVGGCPKNLNFEK